MQCPRCFNNVPAFSTRCEKCTSEHGIGELWLINVFGQLLAYALIALVIYWVFF